MRPINVSLDATTWEYAKEKTNFSSWVRDQLRKEQLRLHEKKKKCIKPDCIDNRYDDLYCAYHAEIAPVGQWISVGEEE